MDLALCRMLEVACRKDLPGPHLVWWWLLLLLLAAWLELRWWSWVWVWLLLLLLLGCCLRLLLWLRLRLRLRLRLLSGGWGGGGPGVISTNTERHPVRGGGSARWFYCFLDVPG